MSFIRISLIKMGAKIPVRSVGNNTKKNTNLNTTKIIEKLFSPPANSGYKIIEKEGKRLGENTIKLIKKKSANGVNNTTKTIKKD